MIVIGLSVLEFFVGRMVMCLLMSGRTSMMKPCLGGCRKLV